MKLPHRLAVTALLGVPLTLFFVAKRASQERPIILGSHPNCAYLAFSPDGRTLISTPDSTFSTTGPNILWNLQNGKQHRIPKQPGTREWLLFSHDGKYIVNVGAGYDINREPLQSRITIVDAGTAQTINQYTIPPLGSDDVAWSEEGKEFVVMESRFINRIASQKGQSLSDFEFKTFEIPGDTSALSPDGALVAYTDTKKRSKSDWTASRAIVVDTHTKTTQASIPIFSFMSRPTFSPKSQFIALDTGYHVEIASIKDRKVLWTWKGLDTNQSKFCFAWDEKSVVLCNGSACVARDTQDGRELWRLQNVRSTVFALSPDGKTLAEASLNGKILLWPLPQN